MSRRSAPALLAVLCALAAAPASAVSLSFDCITGNSATDCGIATSQLSVTLEALGASQARLEVINTGPSAAVYSRILLDGSVLSSVAAIVGGPGVAFASVSPGVLPGGNGNPYLFTTDLEVAANNPKPQNGIGPGEGLVVVFNIAAGSSFANVLTALADGSLRIGMHVQSFASGGSESVLNVPVPEANTVLLLALGLAGLGRIGRARA